MKKSILLLSIITVMCFKVRAQTKQDTTKPIYQYFVKLPLDDYRQLAQALNEHKNTQMYDPSTTDAQKVALFKGIDAYLRELPKRLKVDSVKVQTTGKP